MVDAGLAVAGKGAPVVQHHGIGECFAVVGKVFTDMLAQLEHAPGMGIAPAFAVGASHFFDGLECEHGCPPWCKRGRNWLRPQDSVDARPVDLASGQPWTGHWQ